MGRDSGGGIGRVLSQEEDGRVCGRAAGWHVKEASMAESGELGIGVRGIGDGVKEVLGKCRMQCGGDLAGGVWDVGEV